MSRMYYMSILSHALNHACTLAGYGYDGLYSVVSAATEADVECEMAAAEERWDDYVPFKSQAEYHYFAQSVVEHLANTLGIPVEEMSSMLSSVWQEVMH